jgi:3'-phosphoadenosine 5'-phosphosulfate sulfotransferase (PAPS reductase)/FAD synthetase
MTELRKNDNTHKPKTVNYRDIAPNVWCSYGGGVQTFAMLLLIKEGRIQAPDGFIHADTGAEMPRTLEHIETVVKPLCEEMGIPFVTVMKDNGIYEGYMNKARVPTVGSRKCTGDYKVKPIHKYYREMLAYKHLSLGKGVASVVQYIGISTDEPNREQKVKDQNPKWCRMVYPLLDLKLSRQDCIELIEKSGYPNPHKSGCYFCPFQNLASWADLKRIHPELMKKSIELEENMRKNHPDGGNDSRTLGLMSGYRQWLIDFNAIADLTNWGLVVEDSKGGCKSKEGGCWI